MIDTYNISPKQKYYIALESVQYALYNSPVKMDNVVKDITDYFLEKTCKTNGFMLIC